MHLHIDPSQIPARVEVREPDDFTRFDVVLRVPQHAWIDPAAVVAVAGWADDEAWRAQLDGMVRYAERHGWLDATGRIRAHVETVADPEPAG